MLLGLSWSIFIAVAIAGSASLQLSTAKSSGLISVQFTVSGPGLSVCSFSFTRVPLSLLRDSLQGPHSLSSEARNFEKNNQKNKKQAPCISSPSHSSISFPCTMCFLHIITHKYIKAQPRICQGLWLGVQNPTKTNK